MKKYVIEIDAPDDKDAIDVEFELNELLDYTDSTLKITRVDEADI
jgi:hypothetical protein